MKIFRHLGLMIAVFWCAAMVIVPLAAAADAGYGNNMEMNQPGSPGINPEQAESGTNQLQQDPGQGNAQNTDGPGQGNIPEQDQQEAQNQMNSTGEFLAQLIAWLKTNMDT
jgi:hypothetical protein